MEMYDFKIGFNEAADVSAYWNLGWNESLFQYDYHRLYLITKGHGKITFTNDTTLDLLPGRIYFIPAFSVRQTTTLEDMFQYFIHFKFESLLMNTQLEFSTPQEVKLNKIEIDQYIMMFKTVFEHSRQNNFKSSLATVHAFTGLFSKSIENLSFDHRDILIFKDIISYISNNLTHSLSVKQLADSMGYNSYYFSGKFKKVFGIPPQQFVLKQRMNHSLKLLTETDNTVEQIAFLCGFNSVAYFIKQFKSHFYTTPLQYRLLNR